MHEKQKQLLLAQMKTIYNTRIQTGTSGTFKYLATVIVLNRRLVE